MNILCLLEQTIFHIFIIISKFQLLIKFDHIFFEYVRVLISVKVTYNYWVYKNSLVNISVMKSVHKKEKLSSTRRNLLHYLYCPPRFASFKAESKVNISVKSIRKKENLSSNKWIFSIFYIVIRDMKASKANLKYK